MDSQAFTRVSLSENIHLDTKYSEMMNELHIFELRNEEINTDKIDHHS